MKKCPYCAEEIQDEAIVCKHCGRDLTPVIIPQSPTEPKKKKTPRWLIASAGVLLVCLCGLVFAIISSGSNQTSSSLTNTPSTPSISPTPSPKPLLGMDLSQFVAKYDSLTDLQKNDFVSQSTGKWVDWSGEVYDVQSNGAIEVNVPGTYLSLVDLKGVSQEKAAGLSKGQSIHFTGRMTSVMNMIGLYIYLEDAELVP